MPCCVWLAIDLEMNSSDFVNTIGCFVSILRIGPGYLGSCGRFWIRWTPGHLDSVFGVDGHKRSSFFLGKMFLCHLCTCKEYADRRGEV
mgnify:CR=1 FL=1